MVLIGAKFGRLTVTDFISGSKTVKRKAICLCDCGNQTVVLVNSLSRGLTKSCGCYRRDVKTIHGFNRKRQRERTYQAWHSMKQRCGRVAGYKNITFCDRWKSFENFLTDMGVCPQGYTLDRIDGRQGYEPQNCRWASWEQQANNTNRNHWITHNKLCLTLSQWARLIGVKPNTLQARLSRGWTIERALCQS